MNRFVVAVAAMPANLSVAIEAGERTTPAMLFRGVPAVRLDESPRIEIVPPPDVSPAETPTEIATASAPFRVPQFSRLRFHFSFDRVPAEAWLIWNDAYRAVAVPLSLSNDGRKGTCDIVADRVGEIVSELRLVSVHGIVSTVPLPKATVFVAAAPLAKHVEPQVEMLAAQEAALAREIAAASTGEAEDEARWRKEHDAIAAAFEQWAATRPELKEVAAEPKMRDAEMLARQAERLAKTQRDISADAKSKGEARLKLVVADLAKRQADLAEAVARFESNLKAGSDAPDLKVPVDAAQNASRLLSAGKPDDALADQRRTMAGLDDLHQRLGAPSHANDAKSLAGKLADVQQKLIDDLEKLGEDFARLPAEETLKRLADLRQRQGSVHQAVGKLAIPAKEKAAEASRHKAEIEAENAEKAIRTKDLLTARDAMERARDALRKLASGIAGPTRRRRARCPSGRIPQVDVGRGDETGTRTKAIVGRDARCIRFSARRSRPEEERRARPGGRKPSRRSDETREVPGRWLRPGWQGG